MPYIKGHRRGILDRNIGISPHIITSPGELNYVITKIILGYGMTNYEEMNTVLGVLEAVKQELYRRVIAPYEDVKKEENGDVY